MTNPQDLAALREELEGFHTHCMNTEQHQLADLIDRTLSALPCWVPVSEFKEGPVTACSHRDGIFLTEGDEWDADDLDVTLGVTHIYVLPTPPTTREMRNRE